MKEEKKRLQSAIELLVGIHESPDELEKMRAVLDVTNARHCQGSIADVVRYLMSKRDEE